MLPGLCPIDQCLAEHSQWRGRNGLLNVGLDADWDQYDVSATITGNIISPSSGAREPAPASAIMVAFTSGSLTINGSLTGGSGNTAWGIDCQSFVPTGTITVNGAVAGGSQPSAYGIGMTNAWAGRDVIVMNGSVSAGSGVLMVFMACIRH